MILAESSKGDSDYLAATVDSDYLENIESDIILSVLILTSGLNLASSMNLACCLNVASSMNLASCLNLAKSKSHQLS